MIKVRQMLRKLCLQRSTTTWKSRAHDTTRCWWRFLLRFPYLTTHQVNNSIAHSLPGYLSSAGKAPLLFCDDRLLVIVRRWLLFFSLNFVKLDYKLCLRSAYDEQTCLFIHSYSGSGGCLWPYDKESLSPEHICQSVLILISLKEEKNRRKEKEKKVFFNSRLLRLWAFHLAVTENNES